MIAAGRPACLLLLVCLLLVVPGCAGLQPKQDATRPESATDFASLLPGGKTGSEPQKMAAMGLKYLDEHKLQEASQEFNRALKLHPANSWLHTLNGLTYHLLALEGDGSLYDLARQGYEMAVKFDKSNWIARYQLGLLYLDQRQFEAAQELIGDAMLFNSSDPDILYAMVVASYYARDPETAAAVLSRLQTIEPDSQRSLRASAIVMAALDQPERAAEFLARHRGLTESSGEAEWLAARVADWQSFYERYSREIKGKELGKLLAVANKPVIDFGLDSQPAAGPADSAIGHLDIFGDAGTENKSADVQETDLADGEENAADDADADADENDEDAEDQNFEQQMIIVDVVIIGTEEDITSRKGVNLLNGLNLQFGDSSNPAYSAAEAWVEDWTSDPAPQVTTDTLTITKMISVPALTYSLNIFNSHVERNEILARPTLVALNGAESSFFSGTNIEAAAVATGAQGGESVQIQKDVGVTLTVQPEFFKTGKVKILIDASRTFLKTPSSDVIFSNKVETSKTQVKANVVMNFGETLILSGLSEKETERKHDGVPGLQDVPIAQYLFSRKDDRDFQKSVLILVTPRLPQYIYYDPTKISTSEAKRRGQSYILNELQARYSDWFKPYPNWASVFHHMQSNSLYREFRTGDVTLEHWENQQGLSNRLKKSLGFIYY